MRLRKPQKRRQRLHRERSVPTACFMAANGKFEIKVPAGWTIDEGSDDEYVTFLSANGEDMLEIMTISGSSADSVREIYPDTAEEYKNMVSRGDGMEILSYDVNTKEDGSQTFQYSMKYTNPSDGIHYLQNQVLMMRQSRPTPVQQEL